MLHLFKMIALLALVVLCLNLACRVSTTPHKWQKKDLSFRVDFDFNREQLPSHVQDWYDRFLSALKSPNQTPDATEYAASNDTYKYGRMLNSHITHLLTVLRVTGDPALLYEVDRLAELMRGQLRDWSITALGTEPATDGFLNWQYFYDQEYVGSDVMVMDEMLAHSLVATMTYAFHKNRDQDPRFAERAEFWTNYLKNHFEAKWRKRNSAPVGNFLDKDLAHPFTQWIRYNYYMYLLTGEKDYRAEVERRVDLIKKHMLLTNDGVAYVWDHRMTELGLNPAWGCQPFVYSRQTMEALLDLALENRGLLDEHFMTRLAGTVRFHMLDNGSIDFAPDVCGGMSIQGLKASQYPRKNQRRYATSGFTMFSAWDSSGVINRLSQEVYFNLENNPEEPDRAFIPAGIVFSTLYSAIPDKR